MSKKQRYQSAKESVKGCKQIYIKELRLWVYTKADETEEETKERYLQNTFGKKWL